jgi:ketosteroid isomerase-like protein
MAGRARTFERDVLPFAGLSEILRHFHCGGGAGRPLWASLGAGDRRGLPKSTGANVVGPCWRGRAMSFDFAAFKRAFEAKDFAAWIACYAEDAEWTEYRGHNPPRSPNVMRGREAIARFLEGVCAAPITIRLEDEVVGGDRAAFRVWVTLADGRRIVEHVIVHAADGRITRQIDVEAWD